MFIIELAKMLGREKTTKLAEEVEKNHTYDNMCKLEQAIEDVISDILESENKLLALEMTGVDNWSGYGDAMQLMQNGFEE